MQAHGEKDLLSTCPPCPFWRIISSVVCERHELGGYEMSCVPGNLKEQGYFFNTTCNCLFDRSKEDPGTELPQEIGLNRSEEGFISMAVSLDI